MNNVENHKKNKEIVSYSADCSLFFSATSKRSWTIIRYKKWQFSKLKI